MSIKLIASLVLGCLVLSVVVGTFWGQTKLLLNELQQASGTELQLHPVSTKATSEPDKPTPPAELAAKLDAKLARPNLQSEPRSTF